MRKWVSNFCLGISLFLIPNLLQAQPEILWISSDGNSYIRYWTDVPCSSILEYGLDTSYSEAPSVHSDYQQRHAHWINFEAGKNYHFRITIRDIEGRTTTTEDLVRTRSNGDNSAPRLSTVRPRTIRVGESLSVPISATDSNKDDVTVTVSGLGNNMSYENGLLSLSPQSDDDTGSYLLAFRAKDIHGAEDIEAFRVVVKGEKQGPVIEHLSATRKNNQFSDYLILNRHSRIYPN